MFGTISKAALLAATMGLALASGCSDEDGCARLADFTQMCDPSVTDDDVEGAEALCDAFIGDDAANRCIDCREAASDPCDSDAECEAACSN
ncbi:MAG: hypothetical protein CMN30_24220 [Sandaracinus sp.]|nr:hypothetical protein [Sandaracinus sp.]